MARTFNCGIGAVLIVQKELAGKILSDIRRREEAWLIGKVVQHQAGYYVQPQFSGDYTCQYSSLDFYNC